MQSLVENPKRIFLLDGLGAATTALIAVILSYTFSEEIGIPMHVLMTLGIIAVGYAVYSISCFFLVSQKWPTLLKVVIVANSLYCILTLLTIFYFRLSIKPLGVVYFLSEIVIILALVYVEFIVLTKGQKVL